MSKGVVQEEWFRTWCRSLYVAHTAVAVVAVKWGTRWESLVTTRSSQVTESLISDKAGDKKY